jgi:hypothetical protein
MPGRPGRRRLVARRPDDQSTGDRPDEATVLDPVWAAETRRLKRRHLRRMTLEIAIHVVRELYDNWPF